MKYPLRIAAKIVETTSKVVAVKLMVIDENGVSIKHVYADRGKVEEKLKELNTFIQYVYDVEEELLQLKQKGKIDEIRR